MSMVHADGLLTIPPGSEGVGSDRHAIEAKIAEFGEKAKKAQLTVDELSGGTFSISNGGIFGSLLSTPILNPPQSAILGMHKTQKRPMVEDDEIVIRPMMNLALSYDLRIVDGADAARFLTAMKNRLDEGAFEASLGL